MGMFDYVKYEAPCFNCGRRLTDWQTKDTDCVLAIVNPYDCVDRGFYTDCPQCKTWNQYIVTVQINLKPQEELQEYQRLKVIN